MTGPVYGFWLFLSEKEIEIIDNLALCFCKRKEDKERLQKIDTDQRIKEAVINGFYFIQRLLEKNPELIQIWRNEEIGRDGMILVFLENPDELDRIAESLGIQEPDPILRREEVINNTLRILKEKYAAQHQRLLIEAGDKKEA
ncbi:MAG: hypothetical protein A2746_00215 [Candidatus Yanofskybacteria bacterium RIFCSPHIGHO2_01_FULL_44_22]|uniref:Uncharacterized protein n=1 Tax=Candidatus Yanofskybacteria bacterium RIFCSPHIGHO2_01_FULL_44_22 TaxID=1802669 RepID=A0A1F8EWC7_9BACT|nr:MAG: hypothetical protein A2746_00215 [Candidatus Yanofskybacteria bacterium RIFCSPHIGHO2_01_FULL_44_22]